MGIERAVLLKASCFVKVDPRSFIKANALDGEVVVGSFDAAQGRNCEEA